MKKLVIMHDQQAVTTSLQVAKDFGKRHADVIRAIEAKIQPTQNCARYRSMFAEGSYTDSKGEARKMYYMNRDGFSFIAFGFTGQKADSFKLQYIDAFNSMEQATKELPQTPEQKLQLTMVVTEHTVKRVSKLEGDVQDIKDNQAINPGEYNYISRKINHRVAEWIDVHGLRLDSTQRRPLYHDINRGLAEYVGIKTRSQLRAKDFDKADKYISNWEPSTAAAMLVRNTQQELLDES